GDCGRSGLTARVRRVRRPTARAFFSGGIQINFEIGVREDHRPDITTLHYDAALLPELTLAAHEDFAYSWQARDGRRRLVDLGRANRPCHVMAVDCHDTPLDNNLRAPRKVGNGLLRIERDMI